jgi:hypothetical protein
MTTVVSRLYDQVETAQRVADQLRAEGFPASTLSVLTSADAAAMAAARIPASQVAAYVAKMQPGQAVFVCRAQLTPFGAARRAIDLADGAPAILGANSYLRQTPQMEPGLNSVLPTHPTMMTRDDYVGSGWAEWRASHLFGWHTVSVRRAAPDNLIKGDRVMSRAFWPGKLISDKPRKPSVISGGRLFLSSARSTQSRRTRRGILTDHPRISEMFGWPTLSARR